MTYLITQILLCLLIAFLLGLLLGYLLCKMCGCNKSKKCCPKDGAEKGANKKEGATNFSSPYVDDVDDMAMINLDTNVDLDGEGYDIETLEGIGPQTGDLFREYGVSTVGDFLRKLHTPVSRENAAKDLNILVKPIHDWASMSDLLRVEGIDHQYAELAYTSGIFTISQLAKANAEELLAEMETVNSAGKQTIAPTLPTLDEVNEWISHAKNMSPVVTV